MTRMNRTRYLTATRSNRLRPILLILLVLGAAFAFFRLAGVGGLNESNYMTQRDLNLRREAQQAINAVNSLSRLGSSSSSAELGRLRQHIHGVGLLNNLNVGMYGEVGRLFAQSVFDNLYAIIDEYDAKLISGQRIYDSLNQLSEAVESLSAKVTDVLDGKTVSLQPSAT